MIFASHPQALTNSQQSARTISGKSTQPQRMAADSDAGHFIPEGLIIPGNKVIMRTKTRARRLRRCPTTKRRASNG